MSKSKNAVKGATSKSKSTPSTLPKAVDQALASLFASSAGPVQIPKRKATSSSVETAKESRVVSLTNTTEIDSTSSSEESSDDEKAAEPDEGPTQPARKRRKLRTEDDLETQYLNKLAQEEEKEAIARKKSSLNALGAVESSGIRDFHKSQAEDDDAASDSSASNDLQDLSDLDDDGPGDGVPLHESLTGHDPRTDQNTRTVFVSNVATSAIKSKPNRKVFIQHLKSALLLKENERVESIRFRSTAFDVSAGPKRAAFAKKELMDETTRSTNAYVVLSSEAAARRVAAKLNGTQILDRHIHVDSLADPTRTDNKRCVFVGNLPFVDEETTAQDSDENGEEKKQRRQKAKLPADAEEGLWRTFSKCGKVESVRVVRDRSTRVGKGFAYVQFEDGNGVEKALLLDGKKFPPLLPRLLRVSRAKGVKRKDVRAKETLRGRQVQNSRRKAGDKFGKAVASRRNLSDVVFEGYRASSDNKMKFKSKGKKGSQNNGSKLSSRSSKRGAAFKASGGKKKRDTVKK